MSPFKNEHYSLYHDIMLHTNDLNPINSILFEFSELLWYEALNYKTSHYHFSVDGYESAVLQPSALL